MRRLHTDIPLGSERSSGSVVRFPVMTTLLMFVAATARLPSGLCFASYLRLGSPRRLPEVVQVVVGHVVDEIPGEEACAERRRELLAREQVDDAEDEGAQRHADRGRHDQTQPV